MAHLDKIEYEKKERKERKVRKEEDKKEFNGKAGYFRKCMRAKKHRETKKSCERYFEIERKAGNSKVIKRFKY